MSKAIKHRVRSQKSAFTLIELLVVISIISLLIALLLPALSAAVRNAQQVKCMSNQRGVGTAMTIYSADNAGYMPAPSTNHWGGTLQNGDSAQYKTSTSGSMGLAVLDGDGTGKGTYIDRTLLLGCPGRTANRMWADSSKGVYGFANSQFVHYAYRYNGARLDYQFGRELARNVETGRLQSLTQLNSGSAPDNYFAFNWKIQPRVLLFDDTAYALHFTGGTYALEMTTLLPNRMNWVHFTGGNVILLDGSGKFVPNFLNNKNPISGATNVPTTGLGWPQAQGGPTFGNDKEQASSKVGSIAAMLDIVLQ